jgi:hypothetical protein
MQSLPKIPQPLNCALWRGDRLENIHELLETIETYQDDSHDRRCLLRCRECGQLYFYHFVEFVDYESGEDPQYRTYVPVTSAKDAALLSDMSEVDIATHIPAIHSDWPKGQDKPKVFWVGRNNFD